MMIKAEIFEDKALLLDARGRIWEIRMGNDDQPEIRMLQSLSHGTVNRIMIPELARHIPQS